MGEPKYRLEGIVHTRTDAMEDFEGPLDVIFLLLSKNKIEIQDVSITAILEQYLTYLEEMKRRRENFKFLPGVTLPEKLQLIADLPEAVAQSELIVGFLKHNAIPEDLLMHGYLLRKKPVQRCTGFSAV